MARSPRRPAPALKQLGAMTALPDSPDVAVLERVPNPHPDTRYVARFTAPEFTSLCPVTGQPDFAHLVIDYVPAAWLVESKSLKLYLGAFRNHGAFHEDCTVAIGKLAVGQGPGRPVDSRSGGGAVSRPGVTGCQCANAAVRLAALMSKRLRMPYVHLEETQTS